MEVPTDGVRLEGVRKEEELATAHHAMAPLAGTPLKPDQSPACSSRKMAPFIGETDSSSTAAQARAKRRTSSS